MSARKAIRYTVNIALTLETLRLIGLLYSHSQMNNLDCVRKKNGDVKVMLHESIRNDDF